MGGMAILVPKIFMTFSILSLVSLALLGISGFVAELIVFFGIITRHTNFLIPKILITSLYFDFIVNVYKNSLGLGCLLTVTYRWCVYIASSVFCYLHIVYIALSIKKEEFGIFHYIPLDYINISHVYHWLHIPCFFLFALWYYVALVSVMEPC